MHYIKQPSLSGNILRSSLLFSIAFLSIFAVVGLGVYAFNERTSEGMIALGIGVGVCLFLWILNWFMAERSTCQLCQANLMRSLACTTHPEAKRALGSFRFRVSCSVLATRTFKCPYCGEDFNLRIPDLPAPPQQTVTRRSVSVRRSGNIPSKKR